MPETETMTAGGREELAGLRQQLAALAGELQQARQTKEQAQCALRREEAMGRIRDRIIILRRLDEVPGELEEVWVEELRSLGIPINKTSFQFPSAGEEDFSSYRDALLSESRVSSGLLADYPWVGEAWASGQPVIVGRQRLERAGFPAEVRSLIEVPLPGGGSLGVNSLQEEAFDEEAVQVLQQVAGLLSLGIERLKEIEVLRRIDESQRIELGVQQVRDAVLQMQHPEDWSALGIVLRRQLCSLVTFDGAGIAIVNRQCCSFYAWALTEFGVLKGELCEFVPRALDQALATGKPVLRRNRAEMEEWGDNVGPERNSVVDIPFGKGTLSLNSVRENAFSGRDIAVLERFAGVIAEAHLRLEDLQRLKRFAAIIEESTDFIGMCDPQGWILYLNRAGRRMVGVGEDEDITLTRVTDYLPERLHDLISTIASQGVWQGEGVLRRRDGSEFPVIHTALAHCDVAGKVEVISTIAHDLTGRQRAEAGTRVDLALQRVRNEVLLMRGVEDWRKVVAIFEGELRTVIEFEDCGINLLDRQRHSYLDYESATGTIIEKIYETLPRSLAQALDTGAPVYRHNRAEMDQFEDPIPAGTNCVLDVPFAGGTIAINSCEENAFSEEKIRILEQFARVMNEGYRRLEDLKNLALQGEQLHQAQKMEAIGQLATGVAHEINNPLTSVLGYSELLLRRQLDPQVRAHLETIRQEGERAREIAARLLQFVRRQKANTQFLSLAPLVQEILALVRQQFELDHVQLTSALAPDLPPVQVNPGQIQQLLLALLQNSREAIKKAGKAGVVEVHTRRQGAQIQLVVEDNGPGIPESLRERVFDPFFTTKEVGSAAGSGMGLSLCYAIAREHGGQLWAEPRTAGACLVLELPVRTDAVESSSEEKEQDEH